MTDISRTEQDGQLQQPKGLWQRYGRWLSLGAVGLLGAGLAMTASAVVSVHPPKAPGQGCGWGQLKGDLTSVPQLVIALDRDLNVQGFYGPGGRGSGAPGKSDPELGNLTVEIVKYNPKYCYKIGGIEECVTY